MKNVGGKFSEETCVVSIYFYLKKKGGCGERPQEKLEIVYEGLKSAGAVGESSRRAKTKVGAEACRSKSGLIKTL